MKRLVTGLVTLLVLAIDAIAFAEPSARLTASREGSSATFALTAGNLRVTQRVTEDAMALDILTSSDRLHITADLAGRITLADTAERRVIDLYKAEAGEVLAVANVLKRSSALAAFDAVIGSEWAKASRAAKVFAATRSLLAGLGGEYQQTAALVATFAAPKASFVLAAQRSPAECWDTYTRDVTRFTYDLQRCLADASQMWWFPGYSGVCAYEYNLKSVLSAVWLADCFGAGR